MAQDSGESQVRELICRNGLQLDPDKWTDRIEMYMDIAGVTSIKDLTVKHVFEKLKKYTANSTEAENLLALLQLLNPDEKVQEGKEKLGKKLSSLAEKQRELCDLSAEINGDLKNLKDLCGSSEIFKDTVRSTPGLSNLESEMLELQKRQKSQLTEISEMNVCLQVAEQLKQTSVVQDPSGEQISSTSSGKNSPAMNIPATANRMQGQVQETTSDASPKSAVKPPEAEELTSDSGAKYESRRMEDSSSKSSELETDSSGGQSRPAAESKKPESSTEQKKPKDATSKPQTNLKDRLIELVAKLHLQRPFEHKITFQDSVRVMGIGDAVRKDNSLETLAWRVLRGIMAYDGSARETTDKGNQKGRTPDSSSDEDESDEDCPDSLNPMDILHLCFLCCDPEVRQILCKALFSCKLAFPLVYCDSNCVLTLSQWALRDILIEYRDKEDKHVETTLVSDHRFPIVCFARMGNLRTSKSKLLNSLLGNNSHATFFHRDRVNGDVKRRCTNGLVEATVFLPPSCKSTGQSSRFNRALLLANLRGDLVQFEDQAHVISGISDAIVIFADPTSLQSVDGLRMIELLKRHLKILIVICHTESSATQEKVKTERCNLRTLLGSVPYIRAFKGSTNKNETLLQEEIVSQLNTFFETVDGTKLQKWKSPEKILSDERDEVSRCKEVAFKIMSRLTSSNAPSFKSTHLSLQGKWLEYSQLHKTENSSAAVKEDLAEIQRKKKQIREAQLEKCKQPSQFLTDLVMFLSEAFSKKDDGLSAKLFLQWTKLLFDSFSRQTLPGLYGKRNEQRDELQKFTQTSQKDFTDKGELEEAREKLMSKLQATEKEIVGSSVGLENVFREIGQIYEAARDLKREIPFSASVPLPEMFARLLLWGIPLEILDGDASNIPLTWVSSVLDQCQRIAGDKKIYAVSVLGLQSSGKSTLLNTMFGLKFAVSAGRCTRGAFLQLVPVDEGLPFDYIAVIDTEGLRAPELGLDKHHHDNELATLVIGLGDVTVINIKGENSAEMKDILQIAVHAFIRMKIANRMRDLRRRCIFVHQNVPAVAAKEKMTDANFKMQQDLDKITRIAADSEKLTNVQSFADIISFDRNEDIFYMSDLWNGDPPMAPINHGYAQKVQEIKQHILHCLDKEEKNFQPFEDFATRIKDLWKAIMSEDFVFSFRNSIEMKAYGQLEATFFEIKCKVDTQLNDWLITKADIRVKKCATAEELSLEQRKLTETLLEEAEKISENAIHELINFFDTNAHSDLTIQWKSGKINSLQEHVKILRGDLEQKLRNLCDIQRLEVQQKSMQSSWERDILAEAKRIAEGMSNASKSTIDDKFEDLWRRFTNGLPTESVQTGDSVKMVIRKFLSDCYQNQRPVLNSCLDKVCLKERPATRDAMIVTMDQLFGGEELYKLNTNFLRKTGDVLAAPLAKSGLVAAKPIESKHRRTAEATLLKESNEISKQVTIVMEDISKQSRWFNDSDARRVQQVVADGVKSASANFSGFQTTQVFEIKLVVLAMQFAYPIFFEFDRRFRESCSIQAKTQQIKERVKNTFVNMVQKQGQAKVAADYFRDHLKKVIAEAITTRMQAKLMTPLINEIGKGKFHLILRMLDDMAQKKDFLSIISYVHDSKSTALSWTKSFISNFFSAKPEGQQECRFIQVISRQLIEPLHTEVLRAASKAREDAKDSLDNWIDLFCKNVEGSLAVLPRDLKNIFDLTKGDVKISLSDFYDYLCTGIDTIKRDSLTRYSSYDVSQVDSAGKGETLSHMLLKSFWGCKAQCPFCGEPCSKDDSQHYEKEGTPHACIQHRPQGVDGMHSKESKQLCFETCEHDVTTNKRFACQVCKNNERHTDQCADEGEEGNLFHSYKEYKKIFPDWDIKPDASNYENKFWMWFCWTFREQLCERYSCGLDRLPKSWADIDQEEALESLRDLSKQ